MQCYMSTNPNKEMDERLRSPFSNKGNLRITLNLRVSTYSFNCKGYDALLLNRIQPAVQKYLGNIGTALWEIDSQFLWFWLYPKSSNHYKQKITSQHYNLSIFFQRWKKEQANTRAYNLSQETVPAIMMLYKNTKAMFCSTCGDTDFCDIIASVL